MKYVPLVVLAWLEVFVRIEVFSIGS